MKETLKIVMRQAKNSCAHLKQGDLTGAAVGLTIAAVVVVGVGIPIVNQVAGAYRDVTRNGSGAVISNVSGFGSTTLLLINFVPVFFALALLVAAVSMMR